MRPPDKPCCELGQLAVRCIQMRPTVIRSLTAGVRADVVCAMVNPRLLLGVLLLACGALTWQVHGEDWPQWRGPSRTGHVAAGSRVPAVLPAEPKVVWRLAVGEGFASPAVAGGK